MFSVKNFWMKRFSKSPWIEIISDGMDSQGHVKMEFDWNGAFIDNLRRNGFDHNDEEECVRAWFQALTNEKMLAIIDEIDKNRQAQAKDYVQASEHPDLDKPGKIIQ